MVVAEAPGWLCGQADRFAGLLVGVLALLFFVIFPWVEPRLPWNDVNVNSPSIEQTIPTSSAAPTTSPAGVAVDAARRLVRRRR